MAAIPDKIQTWQMVEPGKEGKPGVLQKTTIPMPELAEGDALVEVAGCGVCHTDLGYFYDGVPTVSKPPLTLGHEIAGTVLAGPEALVGKEVIVPAVMPCGNCPICDEGRGNRCLAQKMPGNSLGMYGGFSSHIPVPAGDLCVVEDAKFPLSHYAVVADAGTTPYQAAMRADLKQDDLVVITGITGGVGVYMGQIAKALGAKVVVFGMQSNKYMLSKLMAFDAEIIGTWGCLPEYYPKVLEMVQDGRVQIEPFLEVKPMSTIQEVFEQQHNGLFDKRQVLEPDF
ncbi:MAG: alcohol dehydrogenase catalytic domain-containing protein [Deltaproteobacteria bacterium]|nr:alcohol dehydrogenase catalytic domain-containing protein [Deltaproteobacteria bacterium]